MTWYGVSVVLAFRFKEGPQETWPVWENVYLVSAASPDEAQVKAIALARETEGDDDGSLMCNGRPATLEFRGVRKVLTVQNVHTPKDDPTDGAEITFSKLEVASEDLLRDLVDGKPVPVKYVE